MSFCFTSAVRPASQAPSGYEQVIGGSSLSSEERDEVVSLPISLSRTVQTGLTVKRLGRIFTALSIEIEEGLCRKIVEIYHFSITYFTGALVKCPKKRSGFSQGFAVRPPYLFFHDQVIGTGRWKIARDARMIDLSREAGAVALVYQKPKDPGDSAAIVEEVNTQLKFDHPHILKILHHFFPVGEKEDIAIYVEKCQATLKEAVLTLKEKYQVTADIAGAVAYLHEQGHVHADLKLDNLYIQNGRGKLGDFGLCQEIGPNRRGYNFRKTLAPEQRSMRGPTERTAKADVYQFGLALLELFELSEDKENFLESCSSSMDEGGIESLVAETLRENPSDRPTMREIQQRALFLRDLL